jgi:hypothetical protein
MISPEQLKEIQSRCEKATPGPWTGFENGAWGGQGFGVSTTQVSEGSNTKEWFIVESNSERASNNALFIAHSRTDIPLLLEEIKRLQRIISKELTENDDLGAEFTYVQVLKERNEKLERVAQIADGLAKRHYGHPEMGDCVCEWHLSLWEMLRELREK